MSYKATVLIVTRNRREMLLRAVRSALSQGHEVEVIVIDDGSTDGTSDAVADLFPSVRLISHTESRGYVVRRNEGVALANAPYVFSIDDDAEFSDCDTVKKALVGFYVPEAWAIALPYINVLKDNLVRQKPICAEDHEVTAFYIGTAHAVRRDDFLGIGGYREDIVHQGEEGDLAIRMLARGKVVVLVDVPPIHHLETPRRDWSRVDYFSARNALLFGWRNVPFPEIVGQIGMTTFNLARHALRMRRPREAYLRGVMSAYRAMLLREVERKPVSRTVFWLFRSLVRQPRKLEELRVKLFDLAAQRDRREDGNSKGKKSKGDRRQCR